jgi:hypothetical protein
VKREKRVVGWREWLHLPEFGVRMIKAKIDTGARTSSLHAFDIEYVTRGSKRMVRFKIHPKQRTARGEVEVLAPLLEERKIRSSNGVEEIRPVVWTLVDIGGESWPIELTLTRRDLMGFRMLVGRQGIRGHAIVDPGRSFLTRKLKRKSGARRRKSS